MNKEHLIKWLDNKDLSNEWLADKCGVKLSTVSSWRSNRPIPSKAKVIIESLMREDHDRKIEDIRNSLTMRPTRQQFNNWNQASLEVGKTIEDWALEGLDRMAAEHFSNVTPLVTDDKQQYRWCGQMAAGQPVETPFEELISVSSKLDPNMHIVLEVCGDSGSPKYQDGERWLIDTSKRGYTAAKGKPAVFEDSSGMYLKVYHGKDQPFTSVNSDHPDHHPGDSLSLVGYPVELVS